MDRLRVIFSKTGNMRFISHLDLVRLFQRAARRAGLPVTITKGFSPRLKISVTKALKLGLEGTNEESVFYMEEKINPPDFIKAMNEKLPEGVKIVNCEREVINA